MRAPAFLAVISLALGLLAVRAYAMKAGDYFAPGPARALAEAAASGRTKEIDRLLSAGATVNFQGKEGMTALIWVLLHQNKKGYQYLLEKGADPNLQMTESILTSDGLTDGNSATSLSAMHEDPSYLELALKYGGDPNILNPVKGTQPIFQCIMLLDHRRPQPRLEQLKMLIAAGADLNARNKSDLTPLMYAVRMLRYDLALVLLQAGADPKPKTKWGTTVVYEIQESRLDPKSPLNQWKIKTIEFLKEKGIDVENGR